MTTAFEITVKGKVQGVFYRASTQEKAKDLGIYGWCKNLQNGDVLIHAEAERADLHALLLWCKVGPAKAIVEDVSYNEVKANGFRSFEIRKD